ncbi:hypothetical protein GCM10027047_22750 [Rhodococcus aerolatus]
MARPARAGTVAGVSTPSAHRRPAVVALVVLAAAACLALGWWQWTRYESGSGSFQNLGYALQWPLFAAFVVYAYRRVVRLEAGEPEDADAATDEQGRVGRPAQRTPVVTEISAAALPTRAARPARDDGAADDPGTDDDPVLAEYNAYLAQLDRDTRRTTP